MIGIIHLIHCPCLILLPFCINNHIFDILYIEYFLGIMFSYTFLNGECPISFFYKKQKNPNYIAGSRIYNYPEMSEIFELCFSQEKDKYISIYFGTNTVIYIGSLYYVIDRSNTPFYIPTISLFFYFTILHFYHNSILFHVIQNVNKTILFFFILWLIRREIYV